jgi:hypothetical protein
MNIEQEPSRNLTTEECEELAAGLVEDTAALPPGPKKGRNVKVGTGLSQSRGDEEIGSARSELTKLHPIRSSNELSRQAHVR